jgi:predicted metal-dependent hydrolase
VPNPDRYCPARPLPPYSYVTGLSAHPTSDPRGHSFGHAEPSAEPLDPSSWPTNANYLYAIDLFNHGYYWEAHEAWESLWHAAGRTGPTANFLKGLIKLAAAGVKAREGRAAGVRQHAERARELFQDVAASPLAGDGLVYGLALADLNQAASQLVQQANPLAGDGTADATRLLAFLLRLKNSS